MIPRAMRNTTVAASPPSKQKAPPVIITGPVASKAEHDSDSRCCRRLAPPQAGQRKDAALRIEDRRHCADATAQLRAPHAKSSKTRPTSSTLRAAQCRDLRRSSSSEAQRLDGSPYRTLRPSESHSSMGPNLASTSRIFSASPTATICTLSTGTYLRATR